MTKFTVDITDPVLLAGIAAARNSFNNSLPPEFDTVANPDGSTTRTPKPIETNPKYLASDDLYIAQVLNSAANSYANQFKLTDTAIAEMQKNLDDAIAKRNIVLTAVASVTNVIAVTSV